jgi:hypothetical protein
MDKVQKHNSFKTMLVKTFFLAMKTETVFETLVSTKAEPHHPADSPKERLH